MAPGHTQPAVEMHTINSEQESGPGDREPDTSFSLPPVDGGRQAYLFLAACVMLEALCWGFPAIFGVFQEYYSTHEPFSEDPENLPIVGTSALGILYMGMPFVFSILKAWPRLRPWCNVGGLVVMCIALAMGSFATKVEHLIATQGVLFAIGGIFAWTPVLFYISQWFVRKLAFAYGVTLVSSPSI